ncbi:hypothetical protein APF79_03685 [bacterium BRH_c32]|nr:MAG: hypothetical protein APF79_03685 [bacterium BRH_c32]
MRYIFQNPIKAGIVTNIQNYNWTNYIDYIEGNNRSDADFALDIFSTDREKAVRSFIEYVNKENDDECMDMPGKRRLADYDAIKIIKSHCKVAHGVDLQKFEINIRNLYIKDLKESYGLSIRQIERLTGINRGIIQKV